MLPADPVMLMSVLNTKLRDFYGSLEELCEDLDEDKAEIEEKLKTAGFAYNPEKNRVE